MNEILLLILEKICEAIYFSMFLLIGKNIKEKRLIFTVVMVFEYLMLTNIMQFNIWIQIIYTFMSFVNLKVFYKEKAQITDVFLFMIASLILIALGIMCAVIQVIFGINHFILLIANRILMFVILFFIKSKINILYKKYFRYWNKHNDKTKIRSLTLRNISVIIFNLMFYILNICIIYAVFTKK